MSLSPPSHHRGLWSPVILFAGCVLSFAAGYRYGPAVWSAEGRTADGSRSAVRRNAPPVGRDAQPARPRKLTLAAVGDVMLDRTVWKRIQANGARSILARAPSTLRRADLAFGNLECPLGNARHAVSGEMSFCADPSTVAVLKDGGFDLVSLANNHTLDRGPSILQGTLAVLEAAGIRYAGADRDRAQATRLRRLGAGGLTVGFLAYTDLSFEHGSWAKVGPDDRRALEEVRAARNKCDLLVVSYHWGNEYQPMPTSRQRALGRGTINAGADLVLGHHPHVLGPIEAYGGGLILYSMGNFVFDQRDTPDHEMDTAIFQIRYSEGEPLSATVIPLHISRQRCGPEPIGRPQARVILKRIGAFSARLGTPLSIQGMHGLVTAAAPAPDRSPATTEVTG